MTHHIAAIIAIIALAAILAIRPRKHPKAPRAQTPRQALRRPTATRSMRQAAPATTDPTTRAARQRTARAERTIRRAWETQGHRTAILNLDTGEVAHIADESSRDT